MDMMNLPKAPDSLCFDKDEFMKDDFDVDHFVSECRRQVQLEELREDLERYYKLLKTAMVELINKDYADFVNLSTNLVGMDRALNQLTVPLGQLREEVSSLRSAVNEVIEAIDDRLAKQDDIQKKKICVLRLTQVVQSVEKIEKILNSQNSTEETSVELRGPLLSGQILERIATEFNQLQFHAVQSKGMPLLDKVRPRIAGITAMLQQSLEGLLIEGLQTSSVDIVRHCLRTYATIDKTRDAEALVGQVLVKPYMDEVIVADCAKSGPAGLQAMYRKVLEFVPYHCRLLREVTGGTISSDKAEIVPGYDFMVNSVWPEIIKGLEERIPSLFNPGNPDAFYEKYTISLDFVRKFERQCGSQASVRRLRAHSLYLSFQNKWNLPVYFQLRYKEIAGSLENRMCEGLEEAPAGSSYRLLVSHTLWGCLLKCWEERIYLPQLAHRFWKLTLQLLSRYSTFITEVLNKAPSTEVSKDPVKPLPSSASSTSSRTSQEDAGSETGAPAALSAKRLVYITADVDLLQEKIPELGDIIKNRLELIGFNNIKVVFAAKPGRVDGAQPFCEVGGMSNDFACHSEEADKVEASTCNHFPDCLEESKASLSACTPALNSKVTQLLSERCFRFLKSASEVPRLYRRTNKEVPTRASTYMDNALRPLRQLQSDYKDMLKGSILQNWLRVTLCDCTQRYYETVSDVLSSVKKMEESLKRLKQARKGTASIPTGTNGGPTDDGKIRIQLTLDVEYLGDQIQKMGLQTEDITLFSSLLELVRGARDGVSSEQSA